MIRENKKLPKDVQERVPELIKFLAGDKDVVALYSFGSFARNEPKPLSDLDFGVLVSYRMGKTEYLDKHLKLIGTFTDSLKTDEIDLILMNHAPYHINFQILNTGKLLLCKDRQSLTDFREHVIASYLDFRFVRDEFDSAFLKGIGYHG